MLSVVSPPAQTESEVAAAILDDRADVGLAVRAVAQQFHLHFVPLVVRRLDIAVLRGSYFDAPLPTLLAFTHSPLFKRQAKILAGYDVSGLGRVRWNA
ncbi:MAG: substrate-binding domain-containing protein [Ramlibacter sp.]